MAQHMANMTHKNSSGKAPKVLNNSVLARAVTGLAPDVKNMFDNIYIYMYFMFVNTYLPVIVNTLLVKGYD